MMGSVGINPGEMLRGIYTIDLLFRIHVQNVPNPSVELESQEDVNYFNRNNAGSMYCMYCVLCCSGNLKSEHLRLSVVHSSGFASCGAASQSDVRLHWPQGEDSTIRPDVLQK